MGSASGRHPECPVDGRDGHDGHDGRRPTADLRRSRRRHERLPAADAFSTLGGALGWLRGYLLVVTAMPRSAAAAPHDATSLRRRWTYAFVLAELVGFIPPAVTGASLSALGVSDVFLVAGLTLAGSLEGAAIGAAQAWVLRRYAPQINGRRWVVATALAAAFAWFVGMGGGALMGASGKPPGVLLVLLAPLWVAALLGMGLAQWLVMRSVVPHSFSWVWVNAGAWLVGVIIPIAALTLAPNDWPLPIHVVVGVAAAVAMGVTVGLLTGRTLQRLLSRTPRV